VPDVLIQDAPPVVVTQPGAAVCQHIMYVSNSRANQNEEIRRRRGVKDKSEGGIESGQRAEEGHK